jgi:hypothetical protein
VGVVAHNTWAWWHSLNTWAWWHSLNTSAILQSHRSAAWSCSLNRGGTISSWLTRAFVLPLVAWHSTGMFGYCYSCTAHPPGGGGGGGGGASQSAATLLIALLAGLLHARASVCVPGYRWCHRCWSTVVPANVVLEAKPCCRLSVLQCCPDPIRDWLFEVVWNPSEPRALGPRVRTMRA